MAAAATEDVFLNDTWKLFFHNPSDSNWTMESYVPVSIISSVDDFWESVNAISPWLSTGMFFLMREHVFPCWDDAYNIDGGCYSVRVPKERAEECMKEMMMATIGETLLIPEKRESWSKINGVSISPKNAFNVIKVWMGKGDHLDHEDMQLPSCRTKDVLYANFRDQITRSK
jgi:translation initiation factor 4E